MSMIRCETHSNSFDSDKTEQCPRCFFEEVQRPQDPGMDGEGWTFRPTEHGGKLPDAMPQVIVATDADGNSWEYVAKERAPREG